MTSVIDVKDYQESPAPSKTSTFSLNNLFNLTSNIIKEKKFPLTRLGRRVYHRKFPLELQLILETENENTDPKMAKPFPLVTTMGKYIFPSRGTKQEILLNLKPHEIQALYESNKILKSLQSNPKEELPKQENPSTKFPFKERLIRKFYRKFPQLAEISSTMTANDHGRFIHFHDWNKQKISINSLNTDTRTNVNTTKFMINNDGTRSMTQTNPSEPQQKQQQQLDKIFICQNEKHASSFRPKRANTPRATSISPVTVKESKENFENSSQMKMEADAIINIQNENDLLLANIRNSLVNHRPTFNAAVAAAADGLDEDADDEYDGDDIDEEVANILRASTPPARTTTTSVRNTERIRARNHRERDLDDLCNPQVAQIVECSDVRDTLTITVERYGGEIYNNSGTGLGENQLVYSPTTPTLTSPLNVSATNVASSLNGSVPSGLTSRPDNTPYCSEILLPKSDVLEFDDELKYGKVCHGVHPEINEYQIGGIRQTLKESEISLAKEKEEQKLQTNVHRNSREFDEMKYEMKSHKSASDTAASIPATRSIGKHEASGRNRTPSGAVAKPTSDYNHLPAAAASSRRLSTDSNASGRSTPTSRSHTNEINRTSTSKPSLESYSGRTTPTSLIGNKYGSSTTSLANKYGNDNSSRYGNDNSSLTSLKYGNDITLVPSRYGHDSSLSGSKYDLSSRTGHEPSSLPSRYGNDITPTSLRHGNDVTSRYGNDSSLSNSRYGSDISQRLIPDSQPISNTSQRNLTPSLGSLRTTSTTLDAAVPSLTQTQGLSLDATTGDRSRLRKQRRLRSQDSQDDEDPIERLNRLKARITASLSEVKGVLKQYSTEENEEPAPTRGSSSLVSRTNKVTEPIAESSEEAKAEPVNFRFVKRIRKRSIFPEDEEEGENKVEGKDEVDKIEKTNLNEKSADEVDRGVVAPRDEQISSKETENATERNEVLDKTPGSDLNKGAVEECTKGQESILDQTVTPQNKEKESDTSLKESESGINKNENSIILEPSPPSSTKDVLRVENEKLNKVENENSNNANNKESVSVQLKPESEVKTEAEEKNEKHPKKNQNKKPKNETKISPKSKAKQKADELSTDNTTKQNKTSEKKNKTNEKVRRNSKILNDNSKQMENKVAENASELDEISPKLEISDKSKQSENKSGESASKIVDTVQGTMAPNVKDTKESSSTSVVSDNSKKVENKLGESPLKIVDGGKSAQGTMAPNVNGISSSKTTFVSDNSKKAENKSDENVSKIVDGGKSSQETMAPNVNNTESNVNSLSDPKNLQKQSEKDNTFPPSGDKILRESKELIPDKNGTPSVVATGVATKPLSVAPNGNASILVTSSTLAVQKTNDLSPKSADNIVASNMLEASKTTEQLEITNKAPGNLKETDTALSNEQEKSNEQTDTFDDQSLKKKKKLPAKTKTPTSTSRRASLAAVEGSKIEPAVKLATPAAIQRRPSDSEAIVKKKLITSKLNTSGNVAEVTPKPKIVKVKRSAIKKSNDDNNQTQANETLNLAAGTPTASSSSSASPLSVGDKTAKIDNVSVTSNKSFHIEADQKKNKDVTLPNDEMPPAANQILSTQLVIDEQTAIDEKPSIPSNSRTIADSSISNEATNARLQQTTTTTTKNFELANKFENNAVANNNSSMLANAGGATLLENSNRNSEANDQRSDLHDLLQESAVIVKATTNLQATKHQGTEGVAKKLETSSEKLEEQLVSKTTGVEPSHAVDIAKATTTTSPEQSLPSISSTTTTTGDQTTSTVTTEPPPPTQAISTPPISAEEAATKINSSPQISISRTQDATEDTPKAAAAATQIPTNQLSEGDHQTEAPVDNSKTNMPELNQAPAPVQTAEIPHEPGEKLKKKIIIKKIIRQTSIDKAKKAEASEAAITETQPTTTVDVPVPVPAVDSVTDEKSETEITSPQAGEDVTSASEECSGSTTEVSESDSGAGAAKPKKVRKVKNKVIIKRQKRKLSISDSSFFGHNVSNEEPTNTEVETLEKPIAYVTDDEEDEAEPEEAQKVEEEKKPLKSCINKKEYNIGDDVLYGERYRRNTQIRWRRGRVKEKITSISYLIDIDGIEVSSHINYLKKYTGRKVQFGGKEYLEIDYEQLAEDEERAERARRRSYSIWNMV
uniref:Uncharacterized protein n=1 Tax=Musca domestica TaxID=7370 RepID=A0A1I8M3W1_MUSDO